MSQGTFKKVGRSDQCLYGPRALLVYGFPPVEQDAVIKLTGAIQLMNVSVIFPGATDDEKQLSDLLSRPDLSGQNEAAGPTRAIVIAGITESELHHLLDAYRRIELPRPLWATLTPFSESWTLSALIEELEKERAMMEKSRK